MEVRFRINKGHSEKCKKIISDDNVCYSVYSPKNYYIASGERIALETGLVIDNTHRSIYIKIVHVDELVLKRIDIVTQVIEVIKNNNVKIVIQNNSPEHFEIKEGDIVCKFIFNCAIEPKILYSS